MLPLAAHAEAPASALGCLVSFVQPGSATDAAGVRAGDILLGAAGKFINSSDDLHNALATETGDVSLKVQRGEQEENFTAHLNVSGNGPKLGVRCHALNVPPAVQASSSIVIPTPVVTPVPTPSAVPVSTSAATVPVHAPAPSPTASEPAGPPIECPFSCAVQSESQNHAGRRKNRDGKTGQLRAAKNCGAFRLTLSHV